MIEFEQCVGLLKRKHEIRVFVSITRLEHKIFNKFISTLKIAKSQKLKDKYIYTKILPTTQQSYETQQLIFESLAVTGGEVTCAVNKP